MPIFTCPAFICISNHGIRAPPPQCLLSPGTWALKAGTRGRALQARHQPVPEQPVPDGRSSWPACSGTVTWALSGPGPGSWAQREPGCPGSQLVRDSELPSWQMRRVPRIPLQGLLLLLPLQPYPLKPFIEQAHVQSALHFTTSASTCSFIPPTSVTRASVRSSYCARTVAVSNTFHGYHARQFTKHFHTSSPF